MKTTAYVSRKFAATSDFGLPMIEKERRGTAREKKIRRRTRGWTWEAGGGHGRRRSVDGPAGWRGMKEDDGVYWVVEGREGGRGEGREGR